MYLPVLSEIYANHRSAKLTGVLDAFSYHAEVAQLARVSAFQAEGCGFDPRLPLHQIVGCIRR